MDSKSTNAIKIKTAQISIIIGLIIFIIKIAAYLLTSSSAIFSDASESVVHILATGMVLFSIILSSRPPDKTHLYGHGNIEYFSAGIEGMLIIFAAITIIYFGVSDLLTGKVPTKLDLGTYLIAFSGIINLALGYYIVKKGKQTNSLALVADGKHILTDSITSIGVVIGLILVILTGIVAIDPIVAILVAMNIIITGYKLIRESIGALMLETDNELLDEITSCLNQIRKDYMIDIHQLRFWKSSDYVFIDFHIILPFFFNIKKSHEIEEEISSEIRKKIKNSEIKTHVDYCSSAYCNMCRYPECNFRAAQFENHVEWSKDKLLGDHI